MMKVQQEFQTSNSIFAMLDGVPVRCPDSGSDKDKLWFLIQEHQKRLSQGPPSKFLLNHATEGILREATVREAAHIKRLIGLWKEAR